MPGIDFFKKIGYCEQATPFSVLVNCTEVLKFKEGKRDTTEPILL
jgi:hypothetical protein